MSIDFTRQQLLSSVMTMGAIVAAMVAAILWGEFSPTMTVTGDSLLGQVVNNFQSANHGWALTLTIAIVVYSSISIGRMSSRMNLFDSFTLTPIIVYALWIGGVALSNNFLLAALISLVMHKAISNLFLTLRVDDSVEYLFFSTALFGLLPLLYSASIALWVTIPILVVIFSRTAREAIAAAAGLLLPAATYLYIVWFNGGEPLEVVSHFWNGLWQSAGITLPETLPLAKAALTLLMLIGSIYGAIDVVAGVHSNKSRLRFIAVVILLVICALVALIPAHTILSMALITPCVTLLITSTMIKFRGTISNIIYILLLILYCLSLCDISLLEISL